MLPVGNVVYEKTIEGTLCSVCDDSFRMATQEEQQHKLAELSRMGKEIVIHALDGGQ